MRDEDLKIVWTCLECNNKFIFLSDVDDHTTRYNHYNILKYDLRSGKIIERKGYI